MFIIKISKGCPNLQRMSKVRQIMLENEKTSRRGLNEPNCGRNNKFMIHKINTSNIQPYGPYPIIEDACNRSGSFFIPSKHLTHSNPSSKPKTTGLDQVGPKNYQRLSLQRAKARQLSSYARKTFSLSGRSQEYDNVLVGVAKRASAYSQTVLVARQKYEQYEQYKESSKWPSVAMHDEVDGRKLGDKRMGYIRKRQKPSVANVERAENIDNLWMLNRWETFQTSDEE